MHQRMMDGLERLPTASLVTHDHDKIVDYAKKTVSLVEEIILTYKPYRHHQKHNHHSYQQTRSQR